MLGWTLFTRALSVLVENVGAALRVGAAPVAAIVLVEYAMLSLYPEALGGIDVAEPDAGALLAGLVLAAATFALGAWAAVGWHRYVLRGDAPAGWLPPVDGRTILSYVGLSLGIGLLVALTLMAVTTMVGVLVLPLMGAGGQVVVLAAGAICALILVFRLSLVLPARAVGRPMTFADAMRATRGHSGTAVVLAIVMGAFLVLLQLPPVLDAMMAASGDAATAAEDVAAGPMARGPIGLAYAAVAQWIAVMLGAGLLTALYGQFVEERPAD